MTKTPTTTTSSTPFIAPGEGGITEPRHFEIPMDDLETSEEEPSYIDALEHGRDLVCEETKSPFLPALAKPPRGSIRYFAGPSTDAVTANGVAIHYGHRGLGVKEVQEWLNVANLGRSQIAADGRFGPKTRAAVEAFQIQNGLDPTGVVDKGTLAALKAEGARELRAMV